MDITRRKLIGTISTTIGLLVGIACIQHPDLQRDLYPTHVGTIKNGQAIVIPADGISGEFGTWIISYKVDSAGIRFWLQSSAT